MTLMTDILSQTAAPAFDLPGLAEGTEIVTMAGLTPVEYLRAGDRVVTRNGARKLTSVHVRHAPGARMVRVSAEALGLERPAGDLRLSPNTRVLIRDWQEKGLKGADKAIVSALDLVDGAGFKLELADDARFYALEFETAEVIYAGGMELVADAAAPKTEA